MNVFWENSKGRISTSKMKSHSVIMNILIKLISMLRTNAVLITLKVFFLNFFLPFFCWFWLLLLLLLFRWIFIFKEKNPTKIIKSWKCWWCFPFVGFFSNFPFNFLYRLILGPVRNYHVCGWLTISFFFFLMWYLCTVLIIIFCFFN